MTTGLRVWHSTIGKPAAVVVAAAVQLAAVSCGESVAVQQPSRVGLGQFPNAWDTWELCLV